MSIAQHTFVFCDIAGWTALTAEHGDERGADVAVAFWGCIGGLLPARGAQAVKSLGDGAMLRCEDPATAVRLGVGLVRCAGLPVHVGIHTGAAVGRDGDWYGTTVNVAARLCGVARGGQVLVSATTLAQAAGLEDLPCGRRRRYRLRNLREPVVAHLVGDVPQRPALRVRRRPVAVAA